MQLPKEIHSPAYKKVVTVRVGRLVRTTCPKCGRRYAVGGEVVSAVLNTFLKVLALALRARGAYQYRGFLSLKMKERPARKVWNPTQQAHIDKPADRTVTAKLLQPFIDLVVSDTDPFDDPNPSLEQVQLPDEALNNVEPTPCESSDSSGA